MWMNKPLAMLSYKKPKPEPKLVLPLTMVTCTVLFYKSKSV